MASDDKVSLKEFKEFQDKLRHDLSVLVYINQRQVTLYELRQLINKMKEFRCIELTQDETIFWMKMCAKLEDWESKINEKTRGLSKIVYNSDRSDYSTDFTGFGLEKNSEQKM